MSPQKNIHRNFQNNIRKKEVKLGINRANLLSFHGRLFYSIIAKNILFCLLSYLKTLFPDLYLYIVKKRKNKEKQEKRNDEHKGYANI